MPNRNRNRNRKLVAATTPVRPRRRRNRRRVGTAQATAKAVRSGVPTLAPAVRSSLIVNQQKAGVPTTGTRKRGRRNRGNRSGRLGYKSLHSYARACVDPLNVSDHPKIPDADMAPSIPFSIRFCTVLSTDVTNNGYAMGFCMADPAALFMPVIGGPSTATTGLLYNDATIAPATPPTVAPFYQGTCLSASNIGTLQQQLSLVRLVAGGIRVSCTSGFAVTQGRIHIAPIVWDWTYNNSAYGWNTSIPSSNLTSYTAQVADVISQMENQPDYQVFPCTSLLNNEILCLFDSVDDEAQHYRGLREPWCPTGVEGAMSGTTNVYSPSSSVCTYGIVGYAVLVEGGQTGTGQSTTINLEYVMHYEGLPSGKGSVPVTGGGSSTIYGIDFSSPAALDQPNVIAATRNMLEWVPRVRMVDDAGVEEAEFEKQAGSFWDAAVKAATTVGEGVQLAASLAALFI